MTCVMCESLNGRSVEEELSGSKFLKKKPWELMSTDPLSFPTVISSTSSSAAKSLHRALLGSCLQMPLSQCPKPSIAEGSVSSTQRDSVHYRLKSGAAERLRRHSVDGSPVGLEPDKDKCFHPYGRQYSDGATETSSYCQRLESLPSALSSTAEVDEQNAWSLISTSVQPSMFMGAEQSPAETRHSSTDPPSYSSSTHNTYNTFSALQQPFLGDYLSGRSESSSHYSYQSLSPQTSQDSAAQPLYPKPIYSYSILIFMALRNSRTGSLPVSEIYSFMTEHFPYFKTAPDGWKNSVRHNLSLNKCFEKVENKNGNSSRKGCLWALNPAKVEKMQEELHKWRRKDPVTVRRSMARPEELDHLLGERPERLKSINTHLNKHTYPHLSRVSLPPTYSPTAALRPPHYPHYSTPPQTVIQQQPYLPSNPHAFSFYPPITQQPSTQLPPRTGSLDSPLPAHTPPSYSAALQASQSTAGSMHELLIDGELSNDIDTLNPSLTDLQLHGHLWEELRDDSLAPDSLTVTMGTSTSPSQLSPIQAGERMESCCSGNGQVSTSGCASGLQASVSELNLTGLYSTSFSSADCMTDIHSPQTHTPVPLL